VDPLPSLPPARIGLGKRSAGFHREVKSGLLCSRRPFGGGLSGLLDQCHRPSQLGGGSLAGPIRKHLNSGS